MLNIFVEINDTGLQDLCTLKHKIFTRLKSNNLSHKNIKTLLRWGTHLLFWVLLWLIFILLNDSDSSLSGVAATEFINISCYALLIYLNVYFIIPAYLSVNKFWLYTFILVGVVLMVTLLKLMLLYLRFWEDQDIQLTILSNHLWFFLSNFIITSFSTVYKIISDWIKHQAEKRELEKQSLQSELKFLKTQINPHFLFNTLNNLYAHTLKKTDRAPEIVLKLSDMMRYMLYECNEKMVPLEKELINIQNYLDLESLRYGDNADIQLEINGDIANQQIAPLLLIPFIENAFKHGLKSQIEKGFCHINIVINKNKFVFTIDNSKPKPEPDQHSKHEGIGMVNVQRRLKLLYPDSYHLKVKSGEDHHSVYLMLDLSEDN